MIPSRPPSQAHVQRRRRHGAERALVVGRGRCRRRRRRTAARLRDAVRLLAAEQLAEHILARASRACRPCRRASPAPRPAPPRPQLAAGADLHGSPYPARGRSCFCRSAQGDGDEQRPRGDRARELRLLGASAGAAVAGLSASPARCLRAPMNAAPAANSAISAAMRTSGRRVVAPRSSSRPAPRAGRRRPAVGGGHLDARRTPRRGRAAPVAGLRDLVSSAGASSIFTAAAAARRARAKAGALGRRARAVEVGGEDRRQQQQAEDRCRRGAPLSSRPPGRPPPRPRRARRRRRSPTLAPISVASARPRPRPIASCGASDQYACAPGIRPSAARPPATSIEPRSPARARGARAPTGRRRAPRSA